MLPRTASFQTSKFRSTVSNKLRTKSLFMELAFDLKDGMPLYTLRDTDRIYVPSAKAPLREVIGDKETLLPSLYRLYMQMGDLTEYEFARTYLESWEHWQYLCNSNFFKTEYLPRWRKELELKTKAEALSSIISESRSNSKNSFAASKYLFERAALIQNTDRKLTKQEKALVEEKEVFDSLDKSFEEDLKRLGIGTENVN